MPTVPELRRELGELGLDTRGLKAVLVARLEEHRRQQEQQQELHEEEAEVESGADGTAAQLAGGRSRSPSPSPPPSARRQTEAEDPVLHPSDLDDDPVDSSREGRILFARTLVDDRSMATAWWRRPLQVLIGLGMLLLLLSMACNSRRTYCSRPSLPPGAQASATCSHLGLAEQSCTQVIAVRQLWAGALRSAGALLGSAVGLDAPEVAQPGRELSGQEVSRAELRTEILELRRQFGTDLDAVKQATLEDCALAAAHERSQDAASRVVLTERVQAAELELTRLKEALREKAQAGDVAAQLGTKANATALDTLAAAVADKSDTATVTELLAENSKATTSAMDALSATVAEKADMAAVKSLLADKADATELAGVSSTSGESVELHSKRLASLEAQVAEAKSQLANGVSREEYSSLSAVVSETKDGIGKAEQSISGVRDTLAASQDALRKEHGDALAALEASQTAHKTLPDDLAAVSETQAAMQRRVAELQAAQETLQEGVKSLGEQVAEAKGPVAEIGSRLNTVEAKMDDTAMQNKIGCATAQLR